MGGSATRRDTMSSGRAQNHRIGVQAHELLRRLDSKVSYADRKSVV